MSKVTDLTLRPTVQPANGRFSKVEVSTSAPSGRFSARLDGVGPVVPYSQKERGLDRDYDARRQDSFSDAPPADVAEPTSREQTLAELTTIIRAVRLGVTDPWKLTDLVFYARHPEMVGVSLTAEHADLLAEWNDISAQLVQPALNECAALANAPAFSGQRVPSLQDADARLSSEAFSATPPSRYDDVIKESAPICPGLSPAVLKGMLMQESGMNPTVINQYGYAGIAQFGRTAAREVGLNVGVAGGPNDERLDPYKSIPAAARLLHLKSQRLEEMAFTQYGQPQGNEYWKFVLAAYNGGEGTVALAMGHAYRRGVEEARGKGLVGTEVLEYAQACATRWENLIEGGTNSPLALAAGRYFPTLASQKYAEIGNYPRQIFKRISGDHS
jgi:soluble lytic murein transglycosylase-like protein